MSDDRNDPFKLQRFLSAQDSIYENVLTELRRGKKTSHWMWYIFPQIAGLGHSSVSQNYAIKSIDEARSYLEHSVLGVRLVECTEEVLFLEGRSVSDIFCYPDDMKFKSCMTLFAYATGEPESVFEQAIVKYFRGNRDLKTLQLFKNNNSY